jgi:hypothetical protein
MPDLDRLLEIANRQTAHMHGWGLDESKVKYDMPPLGEMWLIRHLADAVEQLRADLEVTAQARDDWRKLYEMSRPAAILKRR